jgi:hypothetical protein
MQSHFKTKAVFTLGIFYLVWRYKIAKGLKEDFGMDVEPGRQVWASFIPVYGAIVWWQFLKEFRTTIERVGMAAPIGSQKFSPARAFWWSSIWFGAGPYVNRHLNALYTYQAGHSAGVTSTIPSTVPELTNQPDFSRP